MQRFFMNSTLAAVLALAAIAAGPAAASLSTGNLALDVQSALSSGGNVSVSLDDGVATLSGYVHSASDAAKVNQAALAHGDVEQVVDLISHD